MFNALIAPHKEKLVETALNLAIAGNEPMLKLLLEKILPAKPFDEPIESFGILDDTLTEQGKKVLKLVTNGYLTPSEGNALLQAITAQAKLIETDEILMRLNYLEQALHEKNK